MSTFPIERRSAAECVLLRPGMYTATNSLAEVLAVFEGYEMAMRLGESAHGDDSPIRLLGWLAAQCGVERENFLLPNVRHGMIVQRFQTEEHALAAMKEFATQERRSREDQNQA